MDYDDDKNCEGFGQTVPCLQHLTKDEIVQPNITEEDFTTHFVNARGENTGDIGINYKILIYVTEKIISAQLLKVNFETFENIIPGLVGFALVLRDKLITIKSDGQRHFDSIQNQLS